MMLRVLVLVRCCGGVDSVNMNTTEATRTLLEYCTHDAQLTRRPMDSTYILISHNSMAIQTVLATTSPSRLRRLGA